MNIYIWQTVQTNTFQTTQNACQGQPKVICILQLAARKLDKGSLNISKHLTESVLVLIHLVRWYFQRTQRFLPFFSTRASL